jgi:hypothetical protein
MYLLTFAERVAQPRPQVEGRVEREDAFFHPRKSGVSFSLKYLQIPEKISFGAVVTHT